MTWEKTSFPVYIANRRSEGIERTDGVSGRCQAQVGNTGKRELSQSKQRIKAHQNQNVGTVVSPYENRSHEEAWPR